MVVSRLNKNINYKELERLEKDDASKQSVLYELIIDNTHIPKVGIVIALGNMKRIYEKYHPGVIYFPIYFITKNKTAIQIGVYEILKDEIYKIVNKDNEIDIKNYHLFDPPLLWSWIDNTFITKNRLPPMVIEHKDESENESQYDNDLEIDSDDEKPQKQRIEQVEYIIPEHRRDIFTLMKDVRSPELLKEETYDIAKLIKKENDMNWISKFMKNENYDIFDKDNIFHALQSAFEQIGQQTYEKKLRKKLCDSKYIESYFHREKMKYNEFMRSFQDIQKKLDTEERKKEEYKRDLKQKQASSIKLQDFEIKEYNRLKKAIELLTIQKRELKILKHNSEYMKSITSVDQMKEYILSKKYNADEYGIYLLEKILKIKFIIFFEDANKEGDLKSVLDCGIKDDNVTKFQPEYYILLEYSEKKNTYSLVSYKNKRIFTFKELPYDLKNNISYKCLENVEGIFSRIPDWIHFHKEIKRRGDMNEEDYNRKDIDSEDIMISGIMRKYDGVKILIYCPSSHNKNPGAIRGEIMPHEKIVEYIFLSSIDNWRCILDNNWTGTDLNDKEILKTFQFELNGYYWASIQHYIQGCKFKEDNPQYYSKFALGTTESDTMINTMDHHSNGLSKNVELAIFIGTKTAGKLFKSASSKNSQLNGYKRDKSIQIDRIYNEQIELRNIRDALYAKFTQNPTFQKVLLATNNSLLVYAPLKKREYPAEELMAVRDTLITYDK
jgi:predicted NAD-dependent protein-ADP-ribosyltransferase YbiA (DUF1768 family)